MAGKLFRRLQPQIRFLHARLSPQGYLGLHLTIGLLVILLAGWCFNEIVEGLSGNSPSINLDHRVSIWFEDHATPVATQIARTITFFGSVGFVSVLSLCLAVVFLWKRWWYRLLALALTMIGGSALNVLLKHILHRQRPVFENPLLTLSSFGFPSGHTMGSTLLYGLLALLSFELTIRSRWRIALLLFACVFVLLIGLSRIYLGAHYLSDVTGAIAAGSAWLAFCWTGMETLRRRPGSSRHR